MEQSKAEYQREDFMTEMPPIPEDEFTVFGTVYAHPQHADAMDAVYRKLTAMSASELGTIYYCIARDPDDRSVFHFFERYTGRKAFDEHNNSTTVKDLLASGWMKGVKAKFVKPVELGTK
ncbi:unnamed protein product [Zymoseptoria tritici ST99CH_1A5]|uniref:ABM domain-containing protein n=1 Tax=Zymoseptoria tritici ST99CH_1A5 TaxID=1276529 RepID=A0A1Y6LZU2_ZYMTR|nr:unnamed protein product [Zymoseptoria tritici ST99CH_1A5]